MAGYLAPGAFRGAAGRRRLARLALVVAVLVPTVLTLATVATEPWDPTSDLAIIEARVRDVGGEHTPTTGAFSRVGVDHPGPLWLWALAAPYRVLGADPRGLLAGAALIAGAGAAVAVHAASRRSLLAGATLAAAALLLLRSMAIDHALADPWNPWVAVTAGLALGVGCWELAMGRLRSAPLVVAAGSWVVQAHIGYLPVVGALVAVAAGLAAWRRRPGESRRPVTGRERRSLVVALAVGIVCWSGPIADQVWGSGNLAATWDWLRAPADPAEPRAGLDAAVAWTAAAVRPTGQWTGGGPSAFEDLSILSADAGWLWLAAGVVVAATGIGWWRHDRGVRTAGALVAVALVAAVAALARLTGYPAAYLALWLRPLGLAVWVLAAWSAVVACGPVVRRLRPGRPRGVPTARGVIGVGAVVAALALATRAALDQAPPHDDRSRALRAASAQVRAALTTGALPADRPIVVLPLGWAFAEIGPGLVVDLERHGIAAFEAPPATPGVIGSDEALMGAHRTHPLDGATVLLVAVGDDAAALAADPTADVVAEASGGDAGVFRVVVVRRGGGN